MSALRGPVAERLAARTDKSGTCWIFTGHLNEKGYGRIRSDDGHTQGAHRAAFELVNGPIPAGAEVDHECLNRACVRPDHLRIATHKQNGENRDGAQANSRTGIRGVCWNRRDRRYRAQVKHAGVTHFVGNFTTIAEAEVAVTAKRLELFTHNAQDRTAVGVS